MSEESKSHFSGRGANFNPKNKFDKHTYLNEEQDGVDVPQYESNTTKYIEIFPKTIVNKVTSSDVGMDYSLNPYQGCEHGCTYCYARPTHEYWGYSAGMDFEKVILVKKNAPELLRQTLQNKKWEVKPIILSGNTDCYQPCEKEFQITRQLLEIFLEFRHPVGIITKNALMNRDLDIIEELSKLKLISVNLSITTLNEGLRRKLEPRTATSHRKLDLIEKLVKIDVPVNVMAAPIIPALNDHEIISIAQAVSELGANTFHAHVVRLMGPNEQIFSAWVERYFPDRKDKVLNQLKEIHSGRTGSSNFGSRMKGDGTYALNIRRQLKLAKHKYFPNPKRTSLRKDLFRRPSTDGQLDLFDI